MDYRKRKELALAQMKALAGLVNSLEEQKGAATEKLFLLQGEVKLLNELLKEELDATGGGDSTPESGDVPSAETNNP